MLTELHVKNLALIDEAEVSFGPGLNILTGETGAGRDDTTEHATTYFDGDRCVPADTGDRVVITRSENDTLIVKIHDDSFLGTLRRKMSAI